MSSKETEYTYISSKNKLINFNFGELYKYRDLIFLFVKRSFASQYKQTILGPMWFVINPLISTLLYTLVFGGIADLASDEVPQFVFFLCGTCIWQYFATCVNGTSNTFVSNSGILGKVYFPRLVMPISTVLFSGINFFVVFVILLLTILICNLTGANIHVGLNILLVIPLLIQTALFSLGVGIIVSALTTKYRDLQILVSFGVNLWMYITPVVYSLDALPLKYRGLIMLNPMSPIVENFRYAVLSIGSLEITYWMISIVTTIVVLLLGVILFNRVEKTFMDTV